ncbi:DNA topoisomerase IB [Flavisolibacter tropicus]|uniref:DNA topoisomerase n=1 Tax=Flavisolibacter tropicus TaxID=1492898 RepID=A0A172TUJ1_9BACT|nr:DNA topoisomerase IB [Flavisolibacter tropicus]ANE50662.1 DNA topoisomerase I [Flavisolibacter tropicus]
MEVVQLTHKEFLKIDKDYSQAAKIADLHYVNDKQAGIQRIKKGQGFSYIYNDQLLTDEAELERIKKLAIPPAWTNVWICPKSNGHIQATGFDTRSRKQYRYHEQWQTLRNETKFHRLYEFGKLLPSLRLKLEEDFSNKELSEEKVIATVISLMERTYIRIGNNEYEKINGSYGLTTLKDKHVKIEGDKIRFSFKGKKGIDHDISLRSRKLAKAVQACRDIPGKELFQYYDVEGNKKPIDSGCVNNYIKDATGGDFTAKDFRTWAGTLNILRAFRTLGEAPSETECKKNVISALDEVSKKLGNTRTVCKKYYVHPGIIKLYEGNSLNKYLKELDEIEKADFLTGLTSEERVLMKILQQLV